jgi:hypothetical protein
MQLVISCGIRILFGYVRSEVDMRSEGFAKGLIVGHAGFVSGLEIQFHKTLSLFLLDLISPVGIDQPGKATHVFTEPPGPAESPRRESRKLLDMRRLFITVEQRLKYRIIQTQVIEDVG